MIKTTTYIILKPIRIKKQQSNTMNLLLVGNQ